jgi:hypothetical protein
VNERSLRTRRKVLAFASVVEAGTGLALLVDPSIVSRLLLGAELRDIGTVLGRCFGIAILALGMACWPGRQADEGAATPFRAMAIYNALIGLYLGYLGMVGRFAGPLLWPAVALHAAVALLLAWKGRG